MAIKKYSGAETCGGLNDFYAWISNPTITSGTFLSDAVITFSDGESWDDLTITIGQNVFHLHISSAEIRYGDINETVAWIGEDTSKALKYHPLSNGGYRYIALSGAYLCKNGIMFKMYYRGDSAYESATGRRTTLVLTTDESGNFVIAYINPCPGTIVENTHNASVPDSFYACSADSISTYIKPVPWVQEQFTSIYQLAISNSAGEAIRVPHLFAAYASQTSTADYSTEYDVELDGTVYITNGVWYIEDEKVNRGGGGGGTSDYTELDNKPQINSVTLSGNKSASDLGLAAASDLTNKADKATTLAGYGITDAKIVSGTITLGNQSITPLTQHQDLSGIEDALATVIDGGAKNLIPFDLEAMKTGNSSAGYTWSGNVCTISDGSSLNIVITVGSDGVITATGSKPATSSGLNFRIVPASEAYDLPLGDYVLSGCPAGGSSATYQLRALINNSSVFAQDTGSAAWFTTTSPTIERIEIAFGTSAISNMNLTFKPMISAKALYDASDKYVPYVPSMQELYQRILALES